VQLSQICLNLPDLKGGAALAWKGKKMGAGHLSASTFLPAAFPDLGEWQALFHGRG
jgi:hypothetical protein